VSVTIDFRGVMLLQCTKANGGELRQILLPNGDADSDWPEDGKHPDKKSIARRHFAGFVVERNGGVRIEHLRLRETSITIEFAGATAPATVNLSGLPKLRPATHGHGSPARDRATTGIEVKGGQMAAHPPLPTTVTSKRFFGEYVTFHGARLEGGTIATIQIEKGTHLEKIEIKEGDRAAIYNYEKRYATFADLDHVGECENVLQDDDFIWLYSLLDGWDKSANAHPAPEVICDGDDDRMRARLITVFTCFPAVWEDEF
jgi:hypothetical protein